MAFITDHILTWVTFVPLLGAVLLWTVVRHVAAARVFALVVALADFVLSLHLWVDFDVADGADQFVERAAWLGPRRFEAWLAGQRYPGRRTGAELHARLVAAPAGVTGPEAEPGPAPVQSPRGLRALKLKPVPPPLWWIRAVCFRVSNMDCMVSETGRTKQALS